MGDEVVLSHGVTEASAILERPGEQGPDPGCTECQSVGWLGVASHALITSHLFNIHYSYLHDKAALLDLTSMHRSVHCAMLQV